MSDDQRARGGVDETSALLMRNDMWLPAKILSADEWARGSRETLVDGSAWRSFTGRVHAVGERIRSAEVPDGDLDRAEGFRYLATLLRNALDLVIEPHDVDRPRFRWAARRLKFGLDCPDALYGSAHIDSSATYRVRGRRASVHFLGLAVMEDMRAHHNLDVDELEIAGDGSFEVIAGPEAREAGIPLAPGANTLQVRQFFYDWDAEAPATLAIERIDAGPRARPEGDLDPAGLARRLDAAGAHLEAAVELWMGVASAKARGEVNGFPEEEFGGTAMGAQSHQKAGIGWFRLADDEALLIEVEPPRAKYWGFDLGNFWMESLDYANHQSSLNGHQAVLDDDGVFRAVVCRSDPGVANWLDPAGHREGSMIYRWNFADSLPVPGTRVVKRADLGAELPAGTVRVDPAARAEAIERRRLHVVRRFSRPL